MRIVYGLQGTGKGHLARFLGLLPLFRQDAHEILLLVAGPADPPGYFRQAIRGQEVLRFRGVSLVGDGRGGVARGKTALAFVASSRDLVRDRLRAARRIADFRPDLVVSDLDPITSSRLVAPRATKVGLSNQALLHRRGVPRPPGHAWGRFEHRWVMTALAGGLRCQLACHFVPDVDDVLPPILRPEALAARGRSGGHLLVYAPFSFLPPQVEAYARRHPERRVVVYGCPERATEGNLHFECDAARFVDDLASAEAYVGAAGFQTICEAFYLGKKLVVWSVERHYEQA